MPRCTGGIRVHRRVEVGAEWRDRQGQNCVNESERWSFAADEPWVVLAPTESEARHPERLRRRVRARGRDWRPIALLVPSWTP